MEKKFSRTAPSRGALMFRAWREVAALSKNGAAKFLRIDRSQLVLWEDGTCAPSLRNAFMLEDTIGVPARAWVVAAAEPGDLGEAARA